MLVEEPQHPQVYALAWLLLISKVLIYDQLARGTRPCRRPNFRYKSDMLIPPHAQVGGQSRSPNMHFQVTSLISLISNLRCTYALICLTCRQWKVKSKNERSAPVA